jgi:hypothetical protein
MKKVKQKDKKKMAVLVLADFKNGNYQVGGSSVAPDDMFRSDDVDGDPWDAANIHSGVGLVAPSGQEGAASFKGAALSACIPECAMVFDVELPDGGHSAFWAFLRDETLDTFWSVNLSQYVAQINGGSGYVTDNQFTIAGPNKVAVTFSAAKVAMSINGRPAVTLMPSQAGPITAATFYGVSGAVVRSAAVYAMQVDADLPSLSST